VTVLVMMNIIIYGKNIRFSSPVYYFNVRITSVENPRLTLI